MYNIIGMKREKGSYYEGMVVQDIWRYREYVENGIAVESTNTCFGYLTHTIEQLSNEVLKKDTLNKKFTFIAKILLSNPGIGDVTQDVKGRQIHTLKQKFLLVIFKIMCVGIRIC
ncbi:MAG: hypothetical protein ACRD5E_01270 [Nitrososphaeraceae archaeon]